MSTDEPHDPEAEEPTGDDEVTEEFIDGSSGRTRSWRGSAFGALVLVAVAVIALGVYAVVSLQGQGEDASDETVAQAREAPRAQWVLEDGEDKGLVQSYCTACHSLAPIVTHAGFSEEQWEDEVTKMREQYGAPIDQDTADRIVDYLQAHYATDTEAPGGTSEHLYNDPSGDR